MLLKWFKRWKSSGVPVNGLIIKAKAEDLRELFGKEFICPNSQNHSKVWRSVFYNKVSGEAKSVYLNVTIYGFVQNALPKLSVPEPKRKLLAIKKL